MQLHDIILSLSYIETESSNGRLFSFCPERRKYEDSEGNHSTKDMQRLYMGKWQDTKQVCFWPECIKPDPIIEDEVEQARRLINQ